MHTYIYIYICIYIYILSVISNPHGVAQGLPIPRGHHRETLGKHSTNIPGNAWETLGFPKGCPRVAQALPKHCPNVGIYVTTKWETFRKRWAKVGIVLKMFGKRLGNIGRATLGKRCWETLGQR